MSNSVGPMPAANLGLMPGAAGVEQLGQTPIGTSMTPYGGAYAQPAMLTSQRLQNQKDVDDIAMSDTQTKLMALQTSAAIRQQVSGTMHTINNQAVSSSQEFVGDMVAQAKKSVDNAGKAV